TSADETRPPDGLPLTKGVAMKATVVWLGALLGLTGSASLAQAQYYCPPAYGRPQAPDACGPGFFSACPCGDIYGPNYCLRPPFEPFNGVRPCPQAPPPGAPPG